jgi:hypothetical protein
MVYIIFWVVPLGIRCIFGPYLHIAVVQITFYF